MKSLARVCFLLAVILVVLQSITTVQAQGTTPLAVTLIADGPVTPVMAGYIERGLQIARDQKADIVILQLNTPGGSIDVMERIVAAIRNSPIPVVVYVSPRNAMAGSAGTIITLAGHVAAMAPETTIGAASPVGSQGEDIGETMQSKVKEMLKASVRTLTKNRPPEAVQLAEETIEKARAVTADEALEIGLIDLIATDIPDLLNQLDGRKVIVLGEEVVVKSRGAIERPVQNTLIEQVLQLLVNPNLVFLLLSIGVQAILIELSSPGGWVAGFVGVVCLILAIYGLGILPVNWFGILFIMLAFVLFILEIKTPTIGALTVAGAISFIVGALVLFNSARLPGFPAVSTPLVIGMGIFIAASFLAIVTFAIRAQHAPIRTGRESIIGQSGTVIENLNPRGTVQVSGETWWAESEDNSFIPEGARIQVVRVEGLRLIVRKQK